MNSSTALVNTSRSLASNAYSVNEMKQQVQVIQQMLASVMIQDVHYGVIPGTQKPTLFKPGAEMIAVTFHIAPSYEIEDLCDHESRRYRVKCVGTHQLSGTVLGEGIGECSSNEEKYKWRKPVCQEEFDETPADRRRTKYGKSQGGGHYTQPQIRTEPDDIANTVLKMAAKRAQIAMIINVTACSDCFNQDLEDMDPALIEGGTGVGGGAAARGAARGKPPTQRPQSRGRTQPQGQHPNAPTQDQHPNAPKQTAGNNAPAQKTTAQQAGAGAQPQQQQKEPAASAQQGNPASQAAKYIGPAIGADDLSKVRQKLIDYGMSPGEVLKEFNVPALEKLYAASASDVIAFIVGSNEAGARG